MGGLRPGGSGRRAPGPVLRLVALLAGLAIVLGSPQVTPPVLLHAGPAGSTSPAIGALVRIALPPSPGRLVEPAGPDPGGPDTPGITSLVSAWSPTASTLASPSSEPAISANGRFVAYTSTATTIVSGVFAGPARVYEFDRATGITRLISASTVLVAGKPDQLPRNSQAVEPSVNADGSLVAYVITTPPVVGAAVVPGGSFVIVHDNVSGEDVELAPGSHPSISATGRFVAFETTAALDPARDTNALSDVYVFDRATAGATLASVDSSGHGPGAASRGASLAADASAVAFTSAARLLPADHDPATDVYIRRLATSVTVLVSVHAGADSGASAGASISGTGRFVAFSSKASTLAAGVQAGGGAFADLYVRDLASSKTSRLSRAVGGGAANGSSTAAGISADGRTIAFASSATDLVPADTNGGSDVFLADRASGRITRASISSADQQAGPGSAAPVLSQDASILAFQSDSPNLAPGAHGSIDVYLRARLAHAVVSPAAVPFAPRPAGSTSAAALVTVLSAGPAPLQVASVTLAGLDPASFTIASDGCSGTSLEHGQACSIGVSFRPALPGSRVADLVITDNDPDGSQTVALTGGTLAPTIVLDPAVGPAGFVTNASGTNFPPGAIIDLLWSAGLTASMAPVVADAAGSFSVPVLILPRDTLGPRTLGGTFTAAGGGSATSQPFLVVPGTGQPPFDAPRYPGQPPEQIFRR